MVYKKDFVANETIFLTFGAGNIRWNRAAKRLKREAEKLKIFSHIYALDKKWLSESDLDVNELVQSYIGKRDFKGFGYWAWKSAALTWAHRRHPNALLIYLDSGFVIPKSDIARQGFLRWIELTQEHGSLALSLPSHPEKEWTKQETIKAIDSSGILGDTMQIQGGFIFLTAEAAAVFLPRYRELILENNGFHICDDTRFSDFPGFTSHRNDQSVFSLLWKQKGMFSILDETDPSNHTGIAIAARYSSGFNYFSNNPIIRILRLGERIIAKFQKSLRYVRRNGPEE